MRARVNGIVLKRLFVEGSDVKERQRLFLIDPAPYQAAPGEREGGPRAAEANVANARVPATDRGPRPDNAVSRQEYDNVLAALKAADADVAAASARPRSGRPQRRLHPVTSPVAGRIGRSTVTEGAYVQAGRGHPPRDRAAARPRVRGPRAVHRRGAAMRQALEEGKLQSAGQGRAKVRLVTEDGREYGLAGALQFTDVTVDPSTGTIALRACSRTRRASSCPACSCAPGSTRASTRRRSSCQVGVTRDQKGLPTALVVNAEGKVSDEALVADRAVGDAWLVTSGVKPGDQVVVEGVQKVRPGALVKTVPAGGPKQAAR